MTALAKNITQAYLLQAVISLKNTLILRLLRYFGR